MSRAERDASREELGEALRGLDESRDRLLASFARAPLGVSWSRRWPAR